MSRPGAGRDERNIVVERDSLFSYGIGRAMNLPSIIEEAYKALRSVFKWGWEHLQLVVNTVTVAIALAVAWQLWFLYGERQLVMFIGAPGSSTAVIGPRITKEIARTRDSNGVNYRIALEPTPENLSIRQRMAYESSRIPLGIIDDGQMSDAGQADELRALLPLEWDYLYVLCSSKLFDEVWNAKHPDLAKVPKTEPVPRTGKAQVETQKSGKPAIKTVGASLGVKGSRTDTPNA